MKKIIVLLLCLTFMLMLGCGTNTEESSAVTENSMYFATVDSYGDVMLTLTVKEITDKGYAWGDAFEVTVNNEVILLPLTFSYTGVEEGGECLLCNEEAEFAVLMVNDGSFAQKHGVSDGDAVKVVYKGKNMELPFEESKYKRTNSRKDYKSDEAFANFREIKIGSIASGKLYRSSSPVNPKYKRNTYADGLIRKAGVKSVVNLADSIDNVGNYTGYGESYYKTLVDSGNVVCLNATIYFEQADFKAKLIKGLRFLSKADTPVLIHCTEGKDRAGYFSMVTELIMGATLDEVINDYMESFVNYYHYEEGCDEYNQAMNDGVYTMLYGITNTKTVEELRNTDLTKAVTDMLIKDGLTQAEIDAIKANLS